MPWNAFDRNRDHLEAQYQEPAWDETTGWSLEKLKAAVAQMVQDAEEEGQPRIRTKARAFEMILLNGRIEVDPKDWFADRLQHGGIPRGLRDAWTAEIRKTVVAEASETALTGRSVGALIAYPNFSHVSPDWERMLSLGPSGLLEFVRETRESKLAAGSLSETERDFYDAVEMVYVAFMQFMLRLAEGADKQAELHPEERERMQALAQCLRNIAAGAPETLYEALQLAYLCHEFMEMEGESVRSMGGFDRLYYRFYRSDLERGLYTHEQEQELIKYFFIKFFAKTRDQEYGKNFVFGGLDVDGSDVTNPLTYAALEAYEEMRTVNPKLSIRVHEGTPEGILRRVASCIREGSSSFVFANDDVAIASLIKRGVPVEEARDYILMGCYEPAIVGKEVPCSGSQWVNIIKGVEWALYDGVDPLSGRQMGPKTGECDDFSSFDEFLAAVKTQLAHLFTTAQDVAIAFESPWTQMNSSPLLSGTMLECVQSGRDIAAGGAKYNNTGSCVASLASTVDSLVAIRELVFETETISMSALAETLKNDWADNELLRLKVLNSGQKFGNNLDKPDALAREITDFVAHTINSRQNERGGQFCAALNSIDHCIALGKAVGALPDGRKAHEPLSKNLSAVMGMDREGVTALINSVSNVDFTQYPNGSVLDIMLHPTAVQGDDGLTALVGLVRSYFAQGGFAIQFNIFDVATLREAQERPEQYANLQVRVCGWNVHFVNLSEIEQDMFNEQAELLLV